MSKAKILWFLSVLYVTGGLLFAQTTNTNTFKFTIKPPGGTNTILIAETTNAISVTINNLLSVTTEDTNQITNIVFTNITIYATWYWGTNTNVFTFNDRGAAPDKTNRDGTFTGNFITPEITNHQATNITLDFTLIGTDLTFTNDLGENDIITNTTQVTYFIVPRPPNDRMTNAFKIPSPGGTIVATNNYASIEPGEPVHAKITARDFSVWWTWSSPVSTNVLVDTAGSSFNPVLGVYTGTVVNQLTEIASSGNDVANKLKAHVNFDAIAGVTYRIAVAGQDTNGFGNIRLRVAPGATADTRPPLVSISSPSRESLNTTGQLSIYGSAKEPFPNDSGISNVVLQVNNGPLTNAAGADNWSAVLALPAGTNIVRAFAIDYAGNVGLADAVVVRYVNPTNDFFTSATLLTGVGNVVNAINNRATIEEGEPLHAGNLGGHSIWYTWRAPSVGTLTLSTAGSSFDTLLDMYIGTNLTNLVIVNSNDDASENSGYSSLTQTVLSNQLYCISVDGYGGTMGSIVLQYSFVPPAPGQFYNLTVSNSPGGNVSPPTSTYPAGARVLLTATPDKYFEFVGWEGTMAGVANPLTVTMSQDHNITARFRISTGTTPGATNVVTDDFETGDFKRLPWSTSGTNGWFVQTNVVSGGKYASCSPVIGDAKQTSLVLVTNMLDGIASFEFKVSSELNWDFLEFYLNGKMLDHWSGEVGWTNYLFQVPAGTNRLEWRYVKDTSFNSGQDAVFVDNIFVPLGSAGYGTNGGAASLIISWTPDGQAQLTVQCQPNRLYQLEASNDLLLWIPIGSKDSNLGVIQFLDPDAASYPVRFYRATAQ